MANANWNQNQNPNVHVDHETYVNTNPGYSAHGKPYEITKTTIKTGISFGTCLAIVISYVAWDSIFWAIIHGALGWIYVVYYILVHLNR